jgi:ribosomal-protein-alanine N-acetyltransferase
MFTYRSDKELMKYIPHRIANSMGDIHDILGKIDQLIDSNEGINWAITHKDDDKIIGMVGYVHIIKDHHRAEIGYMLHTPYHGTGIMQEALQAAIQFGFSEMHLHSIEAIVNHENVPSKRILERNGFTNDAFFKDYLHHDGRFISVNVYSLIG